MSTRPMECGSCGMDHPSSEPCIQKFTITETVTYAVSARTAQEALDKFLQTETRDRDFFVSVDERVVTDAHGAVQEVSET